MKRFVFVGLLAAALGAPVLYAAPPPDSSSASTAAAQPASQVKGGAVLGTIRLPRAVKANNEPLPAGSYQVRITDETPKPAPGASPDGERWVEFLQGGAVKGREVASVISNAELTKGTEDKQQPPPAGSAKVQMLKGDDYVRIWISKNGMSYLIHLPVA